MCAQGVERLSYTLLLETCTKPTRIAAVPGERVANEPLAAKLVLEPGPA